MLNMPVSEEDLLHHCKRFQKYMKANGYLSYKDLLVIEAGITEDMYKAIAEEKEPVKSEVNLVATKLAEENPTENPTVSNRVRAIEKKKGGSRRIPRTLKPSSSPSRKRKSQPLSR